MFDIGFFELLMVAIVGLLVVGPERLPDAVRTTARWWSGVRRMLHNARAELEREVGADDIRRELHNERIMRELQESRREMEKAFNTVDAERENVPTEPHAEPTHSKAEKEDYLSEQDESATELQDPEYPEHWHDYGDPELNSHHPDRAAHAEKASTAAQKKPQEKDKQS
ncbi:Sec-independent protein translocase protein TatB [Microbulbifer thermotolerans]|uniref:Sec-independent protein translocase protein TatB n=1 Tax=Microbulbifer thermotolerans TaxID=252514 RepID=A0AB35I450_MICTH|nr:Sec-independent protein translocase protein TatB [Microbulbifer thermotolerans]MCX2803120.1 Sec-independent protein translocase protein TatB [Microbulbifer thermotolerans]